MFAMLIDIKEFENDDESMRYKFDIVFKVDDVILKPELLRMYEFEI